MRSFRAGSNRVQVENSGITSCGSLRPMARWALIYSTCSNTRLRRLRHSTGASTMSRQENSNRETFMHTQEPWPEEIAASAQDVVFKLVRVLSADAEAVLMNKQDYERARLCVNTLAGRDPGELAELERIIAAVVQSPYFNSARSEEH